MGINIGRRSRRVSGASVNSRVEIRAGTVHLVDERYPRHVVFGGLPPDGFRLGLDACDTAKHRDRAVQDAERTLDFSREIHVAGSIDDVDALFDARTSCNPLLPCAAPRQVVAAEVIVMPRSRSCSIQSVTVVPSWTSPILWIMPV